MKLEATLGYTLAVVALPEARLLSIPTIHKTHFLPQSLLSTSFCPVLKPWIKTSTLEVDWVPKRAAGPLGGPHWFTAGPIMLFSGFFSCFC